MNACTVLWITTHLSLIGLLRISPDVLGSRRRRQTRKVLYSEHLLKTTQHDQAGAVSSLAFKFSGSNSKTSREDLLLTKFVDFNFDQLVKTIRQVMFCRAPWCLRSSSPLLPRRRSYAQSSLWSRSMVGQEANARLETAPAWVSCVVAWRFPPLFTLMGACRQ